MISLDDLADDLERRFDRDADAALGRVRARARQRARRRWATTGALAAVVLVVGLAGLGVAAADRTDGGRQVATGDPGGVVGAGRGAIRAGSPDTLDCATRAREKDWTQDPARRPASPVVPAAGEVVCDPNLPEGTSSIRVVAPDAVHGGGGPSRYAGAVVRTDPPGPADGKVTLNPTGVGTLVVPGSVTVTVEPPPGAPPCRFTQRVSLQDYEATTVVMRCR